MTTGPDQPDFTAATQEMERPAANLMQEADNVARRALAAWGH